MDWELASLSHEEDLPEAYPDEDGPGLDVDDEWLDEISYVLAGPGIAPSPGTAPLNASTAATGGAAAPSPSPRDFAVGGAADTMAPGPGLAALVNRVHRDGLGKLDDDQLTGVLQAANRLAAWSAALRVAAVSALAACRESAARESGDWRPFDHVDDEVAVALTLTRRSAARLLDLALSLDRLPLTRAALAAGLIDERRAAVIAEELSGLDDEHAAAAEKLIIGKAPGLTSGQLRALARRAVLSADPKAARQRKEAALKDARVEMFPETSGTAALAGRDLPPAAALAADKHLTALAQAMKAAGIPGTLDTLRARAYLHLLSGQPATTLILQTASPGPPGSPARPGTGHSGTGTGSPADSQASGPAGPPGPAAGLRGTVNLTMPLSAWLGWTQSPGDIPGYGPVDASDSRTLADLLASRPDNQWCITLTGPGGHPAAHACARHGPPGPPGRSAAPHDRPGTAGPGPPGPTSPPGPTTPVPDWLRGLTFTALQTRGCTHEHQRRGYQPSRSLRHLIQIRNPTCTGPGCRHPATRCDLDHITPYHQAGKTCACNLHPACRHNHHTKQTPGWTVTSPAPGTITWTTPGHRTHTTTPAEYWE